MHVPNQHLMHRHQSQYLNQGAVRLRAEHDFYLAPEVLHGQLRPSTPADVYSFGVLMWHAYTQLPPCAEGGVAARPRAPHPHFGKLPPNAPSSFGLIVLACLSGSAAARPSIESVHAVLEAVQRELDSGTYMDLGGHRQARRVPARATLPRRPCGWFVMTDEI
jgi:serine/threonine protein kinase